MTDLLRNPEVRRDILIYSLLTVAAALAGALLGKMYMLSLLCAGIVFSTVHFITVYRRYVRIRALSEKIDQVLHGENAIRFSDFGEGELSVLGNEIEKMTLRLREKTDHLQKEKTYLADAIADISHQLRTPLTSIHLLLTLLSDEALNERRRMELLRELNLLLNRMEWLVDSLLKMSKLDAGTAMFQPEMVSAGMLMKTAAEPLLIPMELREQTLVLETGSETILTDPNWTSEAIGNLLKNCMEHTPAGGTISASVRQTGIYTEICIEDSGNGFASEDLPRVFERFYKGKNAADGSVGIGLALCRMILSAQGHTISAENRAEGGAKFTLRFYKSTV